MKWNVWQQFCVFLLKISQSLCCGVGSVRAWMNGLNMRVSPTREGAEFSPYKLVLTFLMSILIPHIAVTQIKPCWLTHPGVRRRWRWRRREWELEAGVHRVVNMKMAEPQYCTTHAVRHYTWNVFTRLRCDVDSRVKCNVWGKYGEAGGQLCVCLSKSRAKKTGRSF